MIESIHRVAAVACDPGGTNALAPVLRALEAAGATAWVGTSGPASFVWDGAGLRTLAALLPDAIPLDVADRMLREVAPEVLVSGAGAFNQLEHTFRVAARRAGIPSVAVLDDRRRYRDRFGRPGRNGWVPSLPDRICVMDDGTRDEMVGEGFDAAAVRVTGQPHLEAVEQFFVNLSPEDVCRRREAAGLRDGDQAIVFFSDDLAEAIGPAATGTHRLGALPRLGRALLGMPGRPPERFCIKVKPHPREDREPLRMSAKALEVKGLRVHFVEGRNALDLIAFADVVVGIFSMVLFEARLAGRPVVSVQIGHPPADRWWGGGDPGIRVATTQVDLRKELEAALAEGLSAPSGSRFQGATKKVLNVLAEVLESARGARGWPDGMPNTMPQTPRGR